MLSENYEFTNPAVESAFRRAREALLEAVRLHEEADHGGRRCGGARITAVARVASAVEIGTAAMAEASVINARIFKDALKPHVLVVVSTPDRGRDALSQAFRRVGMDARTSDTLAGTLAAEAGLMGLPQAQSPTADQIAEAVDQIVRKVRAVQEAAGLDATHDERPVFQRAPGGMH
jgi:hypothetical protein